MNISKYPEIIDQDIIKSKKRSSESFESTQTFFILDGWSSKPDLKPDSLFHHALWIILAVEMIYKNILKPVMVLISVLNIENLFYYKTGRNSENF